MIAPALPRFWKGLILFSLKTIALPRAVISRLRARPKGFPIALWKPSGLSLCFYVFIAEKYYSRGSMCRSMASRKFRSKPSSVIVTLMGMP